MTMLHAKKTLLGGHQWVMTEEVEMKTAVTKEEG